MHRYQHPVTPAELNGPLAALCSELATGRLPVYVDVRPLEDAPPDECFPLVARHVASRGGSALFGWTLWELPGVFVEAEFHAVWRTPHGTFVDIAPKKRPVARVLFLEDPDRSYAGRQVNNVRRAVSLDPNVSEYLGTFDAEFELLNRGIRAEQHGEIALVGEEAREFHGIQMRRAALFPHVLSAAGAIGPYTPCWCSSGRKVKWCHAVQE